VTHLKEIPKGSGNLYIYGYNSGKKSDEYIGVYSREKWVELALMEKLQKSVQELREIEGSRSEDEREEDESELNNDLIYPDDPRIREWLIDPSKLDVVGVDLDLKSVRDEIIRLKKDSKSLEREIGEMEKIGVEKERYENLLWRKKAKDLELRQAIFIEKFPNTTSFIVFNPEHMKNVINGKYNYVLQIGKEVDGFSDLGIPPRHIYDIGINYFNGSQENYGAAGSYQRKNEHHLHGQLTIPYYKNKRKKGPTEDDKHTIIHEVGHHVHTSTLLGHKKLKKYYTKWNEEMHKISLTMPPAGTMSRVQAYGSDPHETFAERYATYIDGKMITNKQILNKQVTTLKSKTKLTKKEKKEIEILEDEITASKTILDFFSETFKAIEQVDLNRRE